MTDDLSPSPLVHETPGTAGQWLRQARTRQGVHLAVLSVALKVPVRTLELLEADRHDELPGPTFIRALASSVCRHLRLDPADVLALLPQRDARMAPPPASLEAAVPARRSSGRRLHVDRTQFVYIGLALGMVLVIAGLLWWPEATAERSTAEPAPSFMPPPDVAMPVASSPDAVAPTTLTVPPAPGVPASEAPSGVNSTSTSPVSVLPAVTPAPALAPVSDTASPAALRLAASGESWVEVRGSDEQVLFSQVLQAGQVHEIRQAGPLKVVLGRAAAVQVQVKGQNLDLAPHTKVTVARFEVRP